MPFSVNHFLKQISYSPCFFFPLRFLVVLLPWISISLLSNGLSPSAYEYNEDLIPNLPFQPFFLFFSKLHRALHRGCPHFFISISPQPTAPPWTLLWNFLLRSKLGSLLFCRSNGRFLVFILLTPFLNLCDMADVLLLCEKSLSLRLVKAPHISGFLNSVS